MNKQRFGTFTVWAVAAFFLFSGFMGFGEKKSNDWKKDNQSVSSSKDKNKAAVKTKTLAAKRADLSETATGFNNNAIARPVDIQPIVPAAGSELDPAVINAKVAYKPPVVVQPVPVTKPIPSALPPGVEEAVRSARMVKEANDAVKAAGLSKADVSGNVSKAQKD